MNGITKSAILIQIIITVSLLKTVNAGERVSGTTTYCDGCAGGRYDAVNETNLAAAAFTGSSSAGSGASTSGGEDSSDTSDQEKKELCKAKADLRWEICKAKPKQDYAKILQTQCSLRGSTEANASYGFVGGSVSKDYYAQCKDIAEANREVMLNQCDINRAIMLASSACN